MVELFNDLKLDAMTAHWEIAYEPKQFEKLAKDLNYPMLAINCYREENNARSF